MGQVDLFINKHGLLPILKMPKALGGRLFGAPAKNKKGTPLDFQTHVFLKVAAIAQRKDVSDMVMAQARSVYSDAVASMSSQGPDVPYEDLNIPTHQGEILGRLYRPKNTESGAICMFMHGGGFCIGDVASYHPLAKYLAHNARCAVLSVDYRLAPEHPFPVPVDDCVESFNWLHSHAEELGFDPDQISVAGDSAGGKLALLIAQAQIESGGPKPSKVFSLYPMTQHGQSTGSRDEFADGFFLTGKTLAWFSETYLQGVDDDLNPKISPLHFDRLAEMPPVYLATAGFDPLRDEAEQYGERLIEAKVELTRKRFDDLIHGYVTMGGAIQQAQRATDDFVDAVKQWANS